MAWERHPDNAEVPLTGRLSEFRAAIREEIEAARRNESSGAIPLVNGHRIAEIGGSYQYSFEMENILNLPGDAPGDLTVPGHPPQGVDVVSVVGTRITLSVPLDLGSTVPFARLQSNMAQLMRKLIERIEGLAAKDNPVGDRVLDGSKITGTSVPVENISFNADFTADQRLAVTSALGRNTTFIWGPPGTGKTQTIGAIGENLYRQQRSVLLVSHTNSAVDEALLRIADSITKEDREAGKVLRVGTSKDTRFGSDKYKEVLLKTHVDRRSAELAERREECKEEKATASEKVARLSRLIDLCEWVGEAEPDIKSMSGELEKLAAEEDELNRARLELESLLSEAPKVVAAAEDARAAMNVLTKIRGYDELIAKAQSGVEGAQRELKQAEQRLQSSERVLAETTTVNWLTRKWRGLPDPEDQASEVAKRRKELEDQRSLRDDLVDTLEGLRQDREEEVSAYGVFRKRYSADPRQVLEEATRQTERLELNRTNVNSLGSVVMRHRTDVRRVLAARLAALVESGLCQTEAEPRRMLAAIRVALGAAKAQIAGYNVEAMRAGRSGANSQIARLSAELQSIEEAMKRVEEVVIAEAMVVATTLTLAYRRDSVQSRQFDTIILDEASMAPIPAIWVAASRATENAVIVGDFRQLPPIVISKSALAEKWLGRDVFEVAGLNGMVHEGSRRVDLRDQHRMHPEISAIPNSLVYDGRLRDAAGLEQRSMGPWYNAAWGHDAPVLLVDTGSVGAWVTSISKGGRASRLNFLSATICVDIAEQLLKVDRIAQAEGERARRVIIACPYRPHARFLELLIKEQGLDGDVLAGTAHSFQGSEADVVILDLVNDDPHWRVAMFTQAHDETTRRLLNVALTRAKNRLIVIGDFEYIQRQAKRAFLGRDLVPFLLSKYPCVDAKVVVPSGLAGRAAEAQAKIVAGSVEADADRLVVTQELFYAVLRNDVGIAQRRIVIFSPFTTQDRVGQLELQLKAALERGVQVFVVTKPHSDRSKKDIPSYRTLEKTLTDWGITVMHKQGMHEKLVFVDDNILWVGSLNPLSFSNTQEIMERRFSETVVSDYAKALRLEDLVGAYGQGIPSCPICGSEVVASEGRDEPFYWTCVEKGCYSRGIDQPPLTNGAITCANCGGRVEFGEWGDEPAWRCTLNKKHHQGIAGTHLRLPKMRAIIPSRELKKLERRFNGEASGTRPKDPDVGQATLFK
jgi:superfamily I DNA and/or RNA helicase